MTANREREFLISNLESKALFEGRYTDIKCINFDSVEGKKHGHFSLVFRAQDVIQEKRVALKFFDIDPSVAHDAYRTKAFEREPEILQALLGRERCLQLTSGLSTYMLAIPLAGDSVFQVPCKYFAVEWIDDDLDEFFLTQDSFDAENKLRLFNEIVLAVEALHSHETCHRDLKPDNLRSYSEALRRVVVAIDLGAAARLSIAPLLPAYATPVGALQYAAPESFCGLSGNRELAFLSDSYSLGCLLYELFNKDLFVAEVHKDLARGLVQVAISIEVNAAAPERRLEVWSKLYRKVGKSIGPISIDAPGN